MNRPSVLQVGGTLYWVILTRDPDTMVLKDADSTPTVAVRKNGASTADSVTVTKRSATTGIYDCSYNPASEIEGDKFTFEESATVTGTTTSSATYRHNWDVTVIAVERGTDGGGGGTGTGARTVTITVDDGTNPLENARVRVTSGAETYVTSTDVSGVATFNLDDATWVVSITKPGYTFAGTSLVVNGTETVTYSMSLVVITPSSVDKVTGYWTVLDETGSAAASVVVTIKARQPLRGGAGLIHDAGERTATSNGSGLVQFTNLIPGWRYAVVANDDYVADFVVPSDAVTSVELGSIVARLP